MKGCREIQGEGDTFWKIISCQRHIPLLGLISRKGCCCPWSLPLPGRTAYLTRSLYFPYKPRWGVDILMYFKMLIEAFGSHPFQRLSWYSGQDCSVQKLGLSQCGGSQSQAELGVSPRAVQTSQALRATDRNGASKVVLGCSREPGVLCVTMDWNHIQQKERDSSQGSYELS